MNLMNTANKNNSLRFSLVDKRVQVESLTEGLKVLGVYYKNLTWTNKKMGTVTIILSNGKQVAEIHWGEKY